jgi:beta-galactosidase
MIVAGVLGLIGMVSSWAQSESAGWYSPECWVHYGRGSVQQLGQDIVLQGDYVVSTQAWTDAEIRFQARAPGGQPQVQIWAGFRGRDRDSRYVVALRGGNNNDLYLARYAPDGQDKILGVVRLGFQPEVEQWYTLRVVTRGNRFLVFLNDEALPRLNVLDEKPVWSDGGVVLGGGWLKAEYRSLTVEPMSAGIREELDRIGEQVLAPPGVDRDGLRTRQRASYRPLVVPALAEGRTEVSLVGQWLFKPDQDLQVAPGAPAAADFDDQDWHLMEVPSFWTPTWAWLHGEADRKGVSRGVSDGFRDQELRRVNGFTFDWNATRGAWYRHHLELPAAVAGKRLELQFDAIAKIAEIHVNGRKVGSHVGMFGEIRCDITEVARPGRNVVAVHVIRNYPKPRKNQDNKVEGVAVTVEVTSEMLRSLPHGMYGDDPAGIWQPAKLVVSGPVAVNDVFVKPRLDGATVEVEMVNKPDRARTVSLAYTIRDAKDRSVLCTGTLSQPAAVSAGATTSVSLQTPAVKPKLWSPETPNLYVLELEVTENGTLTDRHQTRFGFRTFTAQGNRLLLNGQPYWLRGGNHFPNAIRPNDGELARRMMTLAREGNVMVTRSHVAPFTQTWMEAADEMGMGVSYEGTWPWLMLSGDVPEAGLLKVWKDEFANLIRKNRNHPSMLLWTVNNEMKFYIYDRENPELMKKKWAVVSDMVQAMRRLDPTIPVVADSGYVRKENLKEYEAILKPNGFDDGDVDDSHRYFGWYNPSFMHLMKGEYGRSLGSPDRPLISQEWSTGYPRNDDGHPTRAYLFNHQTPQSLVGLDAYEHCDPARFLERQAFMTKELAEVVRRTNRQEAAGLMLFAYLTWFRDVYDAKRIQPFPTYFAAKTALQPVLVSAELFGRHFYAGETIRRRVCIVNDAANGQTLPASRLRWQIRSGAQVLAEGTQEVQPLGYYENRWLDVDLVMPPQLPTPRVDARLTLALEGPAGLLSENSYDVLLASRSWATGSLDRDLPQTAIFDPKGLYPELKAIPLKSLKEISRVQPTRLIIADLAPFKEPDLAIIRQFVQQGGAVLILGAGKTLQNLLPDRILGFKAKKGEIVTMHVPESPVFAELAWRDLAWFEMGAGQIPQACRGVYQVDRTRQDTAILADQCDIHGYLKQPGDVLEYSGSPLVEITLGTGRILVSEMHLGARNSDPVAGRLLANMVGWLVGQEK